MRNLLYILPLFILAFTFTGNPPGWYELTLPDDSVTVQDIYFIDSLNGWVAVRKNTLDSAFIYNTTDGGNNWEKQFGDNVYLTVMEFTDENTGYLITCLLYVINKSSTISGFY